MIVEPAKAASVAWRCVVAGFHSVIMTLKVVFAKANPWFTKVPYPLTDLHLEEKLILFSI